MAGVTVTVATLRDRVCEYLGFGMDYSATSANNQAIVDACVIDGQRMFLGAHRWGFMRPVGSVTTSTADTTLASTVSIIDGDLAIVGSDGISDMPVRRTYEQHIRSLRDRHPVAVGRPSLYAVVPSIVSSTNVTTNVLMLYPTPDSEITLQFRYALRIDDLELSAVIGGDVHGDCIIEACLAMAEQRRDDVDGMHSARYREALERSRRRDGEQYGANTLGFMPHASGGVAYLRNPNVGTITVNGVTPE